MIDAGGSGIEPGVAIRPCRPVPGGAVSGLHPDLAGALELRSIRVPRALTLPEVEDAGGIPALLRSLAPVARRRGAVLLPGAAVHVQATVAIPRDAQEAHRRRFLLAPHGQRELPPQPLDRSAASLRLDRLAELLVDRANLRRAGGRVVADGGQPEQVARQLRTVRVEDERAAQAERAAEQPGLKHDVVARRRLAGLGIRRGPVVLGEHKRREIDLLGELDQSVEGGPPRVERGRPGLDVGDVLEPARDRLEQFRLLARRPEEDARLVHARFMMTDMAPTPRRGPRANLLRGRFNNPDPLPRRPNPCGDRGAKRPSERPRSLQRRDNRSRRRNPAVTLRRPRGAYTTEAHRSAPISRTAWQRFRGFLGRLCPMPPS